MNLVDELKEKSNELYNIKQEVIEEIKEYFDAYLNSNRFEEFLRGKIRDDEIRKREIVLSINFWEYHSGCPDTYFACGGKRWCNPENQHNHESIFYRGIRLYDIQKEICNYLEKRLMKKMIDLGFSFLRYDKKENVFGYFDIIYYFGW